MTPIRTAHGFAGVPAGCGMPEKPAMPVAQARGIRMLDLHCHMLPAIDDGAAHLEMALTMARMAVDDGIKTVVCTPHIYPGLYDNTAQQIAAATNAFQAHLKQHRIPLQLHYGADTYLEPGLVESIAEGRVPTLAGSRYLLLEPPHHVAPPNFEAAVFDLMVAGYLPVITHPERLTWAADHYGLFRQLVGNGVWMQITSGSLTGRFGRPARHLAERMLDDGLVHILATDAHNLHKRPPLLAEGRDKVAQRLGAEEARHMVETRPAGILANTPPEDLPALPIRPRKKGLWKFLSNRS